MEDESWVSWFLTTEEGKYFIRVDPDYMSDTFNLYGFDEQIFSYSDVLEHIKSNRKNIPQDTIDAWGIRLYGLIHAKYLMTKQGLEELHKKYENSCYDICPNVNCKGKCLPMGLSDIISQSCLFMYCPFCGDLYHAENAVCTRIDGSAFGSSYILPFIHQYPEVQPNYLPPKPDLRLFGFKIEVPMQNQLEDDYYYEEEENVDE